MFELLKKLCQTPGVSGDEGRVREIILNEINGHAEITVDRLGNILAFKKGAKRPAVRLMLSAHMDEVGLIVTMVNDTGLLKFDTVGGIDPRVLLGRRVLLSKSGLPGVIATKAMHLQSAEELKTVPGVNDLSLDIGAASKEEALDNAEPGDTAVFDSDYVEFGDGMIKARALDDRAGCALLVSLIRSELPYDCYFAFTVQEEVGIRGARTAAFSIRPEAALVFESTTAADIPHVGEGKKACFVGKGPVLSFMDNRTLYDRGLFALAKRLSAENNIASQVKQTVAGGNDAGSIHLANGGVRTLAVSLPCRYLHSPVCVIRRSDAEDALRLAGCLAEAIAAGA